MLHRAAIAVLLFLLPPATASAAVVTANRATEQAATAARISDTDGLLLWLDALEWETMTLLPAGRLPPASAGFVDMLNTLGPQLPAAQQWRVQFALGHLLASRTTIADNRAALTAFDAAAAAAPGPRQQAIVALAAVGLVFAHDPAEAARRLNAIADPSPDVRAAVHVWRARLERAAGRDLEAQALFAKARAAAPPFALYVAPRNRDEALRLRVTAQFQQLGREAEPELATTWWSQDDEVILPPPGEDFRWPDMANARPGAALPAAPICDASIGLTRDVAILMRVVVGRGGTLWRQIIWHNKPLTEAAANAFLQVAVHRGLTTRRRQGFKLWLACSESGLFSPLGSVLEAAVDDALMPWVLQKGGHWTDQLAGAGTSPDPAQLDVRLADIAAEAGPASARLLPLLLQRARLASGPEQAPYLARASEIADANAAPLPVRAALALHRWPADRDAAARASARAAVGPLLAEAQRPSDVATARVRLRLELHLLELTLVESMLDLIDPGRRANGLADAGKAPWARIESVLATAPAVLPQDDPARRQVMLWAASIAQAAGDMPRAIAWRERAGLATDRCAFNSSDPAQNLVTGFVISAKDYPKALRAREITGYQEFERLVAADGSTTGVRIVQALPPWVFDKPLIAAAMQARQPPPLRDGKPFPCVSIRQPVRWNLEN